MDTLTQLLSIGIVGSALSVAIQYIKSKWGMDSNTTKASTVLLSLGLGACYYFLVNTSLWLPLLGVLGAASTFYSLFLKETALGEGIKNIAQ